jgi:hypothetical protein
MLCGKMLLYFECVNVCVWVTSLRETVMKPSHCKIKNHYIKIFVGKSLGKQPLGSIRWRVILMGFSQVRIRSCGMLE